MSIVSQPPLILLKIGGSVCTDKAGGTFEIHLGHIQRIAEEITAARRYRPFHLLIVHGAGPFGHKLVHDFGIRDGLREAGDVDGFLATHTSVAQLNAAIVAQLNRHGVRAFPVQPSACFVSDKKRIAKAFLDPLQRLLELPEVVPVLYGDMIADISLGASVVSGDQSIAYLAQALRADVILLGTDVDGVLSGDPTRDSSASLIENLSVGTIEARTALTGSTATDVTGGMRGKVAEFADIAGTAHVVIFNLNTPGLLTTVLHGERIRGTVLHS